MGRKSTIARLPGTVKDCIDALLARGAFTLDDLRAELERRFPQEAASGALPSRSSLHRYGQKLEQRLSAIRASTEAARIISEQIGDKSDARSEALMALVQSELFDSIMALQSVGADTGGMPPEERLQLLSNVGKNISTIARGSVNLKEFQARSEAAAEKRLLEKQRAKLDALTSKGGVTPETNAAIRAALGIV